MKFDELQKLVFQLAATGCRYNPTSYRSEVAVSLRFSHLLDALVPGLPKSVRGLLDESSDELEGEAKEVVSTIAEGVVHSVARGLYRIRDELAGHVENYGVDRDDCVLCVLVDDLPAVFNDYMALFIVTVDDVVVHYLGRDKRRCIPMDEEEED